MATPLREIFVQFAAEFDFEGFEEANKQTEELKGNLAATGKVAGKTSTQGVALKGAMQGVAGGLGAAGVQAGILGSAMAALASPITAVVAAIAAIVVGFVAWIAATKSLITTIFEFSSTMAEVGGQIANISARLGIATADLQAWSQALAEGNIGTEKLADALTDLGEKIGASIQDPASGTARLFRRLGIDLKDTEGNVRSVGDVFLDLAEAMDNTESASERITNANQLMGGSGRELIPILVQGRAGLEAYREQLGLSQPEFEEFIANSIKLSEEQAKLNQAWEGTKQILFNIVAPAVIWVVTKLQELVLWLNNNKAALESLKIIAIVLTASFAALGVLLGVLTAVLIAMLVSAFLPLIITLGWMTLAFTAGLLAGQDFMVFLQGGDSVFERFLGWLFDIPHALREMVLEFVATDSALGRFLDNLSLVANSLLEVFNAMRRLRGLPQIEVDFRQNLESALESPEPEAERLAARQTFIENQRGFLQNAFGVEATAINRRERTERSLRQQGVSEADVTRLTQTIGPPTPIQTASPGARAAARIGGGSAGVRVTQNNELHFNINEASDVEGIQRVVTEALTTQNRDLQEVLGGAES